MKWVGRIGGVTLLLCLLAGLIVGYYYLRTPSGTVVVVPEPLPPGLPAGLTAEQFGNYLLASFQNIRIVAESAPAAGMRAPQATPGIQVVSAAQKSPFISLQVPLPPFDQKIRGVSIGSLREWGVSLKARRLILLEATPAGGSSFRLLAMLQERPNFETRYSWWVPVAGGPCSNLETCSRELAEEILAVLEPHPLVLFYLKQGEEDAFRKIVKLYESGRIPTASLTRDDLMAWGNGLLGIKEFDQAIRKYQEALNLNTNTQFCPAYDAIGYASIIKYEGERRMEHLDAAESAYRDAIACDSRDPFAHCNLGNVLIRKWLAGGKHNGQLAQEAMEHSQRASTGESQLPREAAAVNIGYLRYMQNQREQALDYFREISQKFPTNSALFLNYGYLLYREYLRGRNELLQEATKRTQRAWELDPKSYMAAANLGFFYYEADALQDAVQSWKEAYHLNPNEPDILAGLALGLFKSGQQDEAMKYYRTAMRQEPQIRNSEYLRHNHFWSDKAARDVVPLIQAVIGPSK